MLNDAHWAELEARDPALIERVSKDLVDLARGRCGWAEVLRIEDAELLGMARLAIAKLDHGRVEEAEHTLRVLTQLDPFVSWFWMALGDACSRRSKVQEAIDCYDRCIFEASQLQPPAEDEIRKASLRRGKLQVRSNDSSSAVADFTRVLELDTDETLSGEHAWLAVQSLADKGVLTPEQLDRLQERRRTSA